MSLDAAIESFLGPDGSTFARLERPDELRRDLRGSYALLAALPAVREIAPGRLGPRSLSAGMYVYCGSALGGLRGRIERHLRSARPDQMAKRHWHVDYLLEHGSVVGLWVAISDERLECLLARHLLVHQWASLPIPGFGSSDCRCPGHLVQWAPRG